MMDGRSILFGRKWQTLYWSLGGITLFAIGLAASIVQGVNTWDEAWFLQVVSRVAHGDILYRDVFFGVTPLSAYLMLPFIQLFGSEVVLVKAGMAVCYALTILLAARIVQQLGHKGISPYLLILALAAYLLPQPDSPYKAMAEVFLLLCFSLTLNWLQGADAARPAGRSLRTLFAAGACAGACFLSNQWFGVLTLGALALTITINSRLARPEQGIGLPRNLVLAGSGFASVLALLLLPVWISGGGPKFADYAFLNKRTYADVAGVSYFYQLGRILPFFASPTISNFVAAFRGVAYLLPPIVLVMLTVKSSLPRAEQARSAALLFFSGSAVLAALPRVDWYHFASAVPMLLIGLVDGIGVVARPLPKSWTRLAWATISIGLLAAACVEAGSLRRNLGASGLSVSGLPHFWQGLFTASRFEAIRSYSNELKQAAGNQPLLILTPDAGFYYLVSGLRNPSPYDYPLVTAFGTNGEAELVGRLARHEIPLVCLNALAGTHTESLRPLILETYVETHLHRERDIGLCTLYSTP